MPHGNCAPPGPSCESYLTPHGPVEPVSLLFCRLCNGLRWVTMSAITRTRGPRTLREYHDSTLAPKRLPSPHLYYATICPVVFHYFHQAASGAAVSRCAPPASIAYKSLLCACGRAA